MYVRKFEADTLDEALKQIKQELGPDAVILKTITNKGLKGAFKKRKIEITAAISEKNLGNKMKVDKVLSTDQKKEFYQEKSSSISKKIEHYNQKPSAQTAAPITYGNAGLNRAVQTMKETMKSGLDEFLGEFSPTQAKAPASSSHGSYHSFENAVEEEEGPIVQPRERKSVANSTADLQVIHDLESRLAGLEEKLLSLHGQLENTKVKNSPNKILNGAFDYLRSLDLVEKFINETYKKLVFELNDDEQKDKDLIFDFILREMDQRISLGMPMFSQSQQSNQGTLTVFVSEVASGQSSCIFKIAALKKDCSIVVFDERATTQNLTAAKMLGLKITHTSSFQEAVAAIRKSVEDGVSVFLDLKLSSQKEESKKMVEGLKRAFPLVEIIVSLSAIHSQGHNLKLLKKFSSLAQGMVVNHLDLCLNFAQVFNLTYNHPDIPMYFFGTGQVVPEDLEAASKERLLGNLFNL